ncbi:MAG: hypothetical protein CL908_06730 [Deltaproteobacteria bacterium]|nr:hypothetical protein [Deltaproteobacteria bacterium]
MRWWKAKSSEATGDSTTVGIAVEPDRVTFVACKGDGDEHPRIIAWETSAIDSPADVQSAAQRFVDENDLQGWPARATLSPEDYSLRLVERPSNVPDDELVDATRWLIRDLIEFDVESAELAILSVPKDSSRARTPRMFVVAARHEPVLELAQMIDAAGLRVSGFDVVESAMLALDTRMPEVVGGSAVLRIGDKSSVLTLSNEAHLYLARTLSVSGDSIEVAAQCALEEDDPASSNVIELLDPLLLDVQRSLDYYESEYGQAPASRLALLASDVEMTPLLPALCEALRPLQVESYEFERFFDFDEAPPSQALPSIALAAGAAVAGAEGVGNALVPSILRPQRGGFGLSSAVGIAASIALLLGIYSGISWFMLDKERGELAALDADRAGLSAEIESLHAEAEANAANVDPQGELETLRAQRDIELSMLRDIGRHGASSDASFSTLLAGLARQDLEGVWLERIEFANGGESISIEGRSLQADDVPAFLRGLGREKSFERRRFRQFEMARTDDTPGLAFRIATLADGDGDGRDRR